MECPPAQSMEFWHGLRAVGAPTTLVVYEGEGHRLRHNTVAKTPYLTAIAAAPRRSAARRAAYAEMHGVLQQESAVSRVLVEWRDKLDHAVARRDREAVLFDRELFYAIQPRERLEGLIADVRQLIG